MCVIALLVVDSDGELSYSEFFSSFHLSDPALKAIQDQHVSAQATRNLSGSGVPPPETPSPTLTPRQFEEHKMLGSG